jgi:8-oxo-dGTP pyrophosphatase MutT (NUDIX family)
MTQQNPWKRVSSKVVYKNPWITVREDQVIRPDGKDGIYGVVQPRIATGVIALTPTREIVLIGQYRYPVECYSWEIVEGGGDDGETPLAAAKRELREEAGIEAHKWQQLGDVVHLSNCHSSEQAYFFVAEDLSFGVPQPDSFEILQTQTVPFERALAMVDQGEITDAMSIIAILRLERLWRS